MQTLGKILEKKYYFSLGMPSDSKKIYDALYEIKGDHESVKNEFIKCFNLAVYAKIKK